MFPNFTIVYSRCQTYSAIIFIVITFSIEQLFLSLFFNALLASVWYNIPVTITLHTFTY